MASTSSVPKKLSYRFLPGTGVKVSDLCLGAMTFSTTGKGPWGIPVANQSTSHAILDRFIELGGNFIDTADAYAESEACIGNWLSSKSNIADFRDSLVLATKVTSTTGMGPNDVGQSKKHILYNVEKSLKAMQTNYIDLYQLHMIDYKTKIEDVARTMNDLVRSGKVHYFGVSNFPAYQLQKLIDYCKYIGIERVISNQSQYSLMCRSAEWELLPQCATEELAFLPWSPLAGGWLSGKFKRGINEPPESSRVQWAESVGFRPTDFKSNAQQQTFDIIDEVFNIANEIKASPAQVSLRWLLQKPQVTSVIIGAKTLEQFEDNVAASFIKLSDEQMKRLDQVSDVPMPYPYSMIQSILGRSGRL